MKCVHVLGIAVAMISIVGTTTVLAKERDRFMRPIVPPDQLAAARALKTPVPYTPEVIAKGKALYEGKGACFTCHGMTGQGDGPAAANLTPAPRNFHHRGMWRHRTDGEIFWVIKHGSPGTGMMAFGGMLSDEEIWTVLQYERSFSESGGGPGGRGGKGGGRGGHRGPPR